MSSFKYLHTNFWFESLIRLVPFEHTHSKFSFEYLPRKVSFKSCTTIFIRDLCSNILIRRFSFVSLHLTLLFERLHSNLVRILKLELLVRVISFTLVFECLHPNLCSTFLNDFSFGVSSLESHSTIFSRIFRLNI